MWCHTHRGWIMNGYLRFGNLGQLLEAMTERNMTKLERVRPILLKHSHHLFTHPLHLRDRRETKESIWKVNSTYGVMRYTHSIGKVYLWFCKLHHIITDTVQQSNGVGTQTWLLVTPHLILWTGENSSHHCITTHHTLWSMLQRCVEWCHRIKQGCIYRGRVLFILSCKVY